VVGVRKRGAQKGSTMDVCACICLMHEVDFGGNWQLATGKMACLACIDNQGIGATAGILGLDRLDPDAGGCPTPANT
jgi:hypothetical protein